jgi:hypothetical protein
MARATNPEPLTANVRYTGSIWVAVVDTPQGKLEASHRRSTKAFARLESIAREKLGERTTLKPHYHIPKEWEAEYKVFVKKLQLYKELEPYIMETRGRLALGLTETGMPGDLVAPLVGVSPQRLGRILDDLAHGKPAYGVRGRPKSKSEDDGGDE